VAIIGCGGCRNEYYCSNEHATLAWTTEHHTRCSSIAAPNTSTSSQSQTEWDVRKGSRWTLPIPVTEVWLKNLVGQGSYGKVYAACSDEDCSNVVIIKLQQLSDTSDVKTFEREAAISRLMDYNKVGPKIFFAEVVKKSSIEHLFENHPPEDIDTFGVIVMERWDTDLASVSSELFKVRANVETALTLLRTKISRMHETVLHCDLTFKNILVRVEHTSEGLKLLDLAIADYGLAIWNRNVFEVNTYELGYFMYLLASAVANRFGEYNIETLQKTRFLNQNEFAFLKLRGQGGTFDRFKEMLRKDYKTVDRYILKVVEQFSLNK
jgi:serine/threonine protein kinase